jgi:predicted metalloprotease
MQWKGRRQSTNVDDRRKMGTGTIATGGGIAAIIIVIIGLLLGGGGDLGSLFGDSSGAVSGGSNTTMTLTAQQEEMGDFVKVILADTEDFWNQQFTAAGYTYEEPKLVLFSGSVSTASGYATSATGPFYSPPDKTVYIDLSFFQEMESKYGAGGDFTRAYVISHEVGHHVQNLLGTLSQVSAQQQQVSSDEKNALSVRLELQADFYAGAFAHYENSKGYLEAGDVDEAVNAASAIGDDRLQMQAQGYVVPDSFTHGTSEQRSRWFKLGYTTGDPSKADTFSPAYNSL